MSPTKLNRYELIEELGRGGMATVYRAYDPIFEREVALKVLPPEFLHDPQFKERFHREIKTIAKLEHPAIVPVYDVGEDAGLPYFVMRYMTGGSLADQLKDGKYSLQDTTRIIERLAGALAYAHKKGIIHRDLKPDNILFDNNGDPFISDFGVAKIETSASNLTGSMVVGTPAYMSPEQAQTGDIDIRSDIYGIGVILYQLLSGILPYEATTPMGVIFKHINDPIPDILKVNPELPKDVNKVIKTAMAKEKENRYATALEVAQALNQAVYSSQDTSTSPPFFKRLIKFPAVMPSNRLWIIVGSIILVLMLSGIIFLGNKSNIALAVTPTEEIFEVTLPGPVGIPTQAAPTAIPVPGATDRIAFVSGRNIWLMNPDGSNVVQVTNTNSGRSHLQWLPDGKSVLYITDTCAFSVDAITDQIDTVVCFKQVKLFEGFRISPDGTLVAISLNRELFVVPFDREKLKKVENKSDLLSMDNSCFYNLAAAQDIRWSKDGKRLAIIYLDTASRLNERIRLLDISSCPAASPKPQTDFPAMESLPEGFLFRPEIPDFDWDGEQLFLFNDFIQNEGFGNLYLYDTAIQQMSKINPIDGVCCYRDARWSPDGNFVLFLFQDSRAEQIINQFYFVTYSELLSGQIGLPFKFPDKVLTNPNEQPQPAMRPIN